MDNGRLIDAAEALASMYDADGRQDIKTDVINAFYAGVKFGAIEEREACALLCDAISKQHAWDRRSSDLAMACRDEIKARSN